MIGIVNAGTLHAGLKLGSRLIASGNTESLPFLREVFAGAVDAKHPAASDELLRQIQHWIVPVVRQAGIPAHATDLGKVSKIIRDLTAYGFADEAVRILITAIGFDPSKSAELVDAIRKAFAKPQAGQAEGAGEIASGLMDMGLGYLKSGVVDGITFMSAARRVGQVPLPMGEIEQSFDDIPSRAVVREHAVAQDVTNYAYDVQRVGPLKAAVGIGMLIPSMLDTEAEQDIITGLGSYSSDPGVIHLGRYMTSRGYAPQAAELMMSGVSPQAAWNAFDKQFVVPHPAVNPPGVMKSYGRVVTNAVASVARTAQPPDFDAMRKIVFEHGGRSEGMVAGEDALERMEVAEGDTGEASSTNVQPAKSKQFYFALEGDGVRCDEAMWDAEFDLVFKYDSPPPDVLAKLHGDKFEVLKNSEATLRIIVNPIGFELADGVSARDVKFAGGKMQSAAPRFRLRAPAKKPADRSRFGVSVSFSLNNNSPLYDVFLPIKLVDQLGTAPCSDESLDLDFADMVAGASSPRAGQVFILADSESWWISWYFGQDEDDIQEKEKTTKLSAGKLAASYEKDLLLTELNGIAKEVPWRFVDENLMLPNQVDMKEFSEGAIKRAKDAGIKLYKILKKEPLLEKLMAKIDRLRDGSRITFRTDDTVFPWELIYIPAASEPADAVNPNRFWGARFHIESLLFINSGTQKIRPPARQPGALHISGCFDASIDNEDPWIKKKPGPVEKQVQYLGQSFQDRRSYTDKHDEVLKILTQADPASMIYFYCHGDTNTLEVEKGRKITFDKVDGPGYPHWPIIFINACDAGNISPLSLMSFRDEFRKKNAAGVIAPSFQIPAMFAAQFARSVLDGYDQRLPIGEVIFALRWRLLQQNNPLGLWYSIQCPLDITAPPREP